MSRPPFLIATLLGVWALSALANDSAPPDAGTRKIFDNFDTNRDGGISLDEYKAGMIGNMSPSRVENVFQEKDRNHDGKLNLDELLYVPRDQRPAATPEKKNDKSEKSDKKDLRKAKNKISQWLRSE